MNIALLGATGNVGSVILQEACRRGHLVTAIARNVGGIPSQPGVRTRAADVNSEVALSAAVAGHDAVISAVKFVAFDAGIVLRAIAAAGLKRLLVVGGAGSLQLPDGSALVDSPQFPAEYKKEAEAGRAFLRKLQGEAALDWIFLSPSAYLSPGPATGRFRIGSDQLLIDAAGESRVSVGDFALAMIDELERPQHSRQRFTVGY